MKEIIFCTTQKSPFGFLIMSLRFSFDIVFDQFSNQSFIPLSDALDRSEFKHNFILSFYVGVMDMKDVGEFVSLNDYEMGHIDLLKF